MWADGRNLTLTIGGVDVQCDATSVLLDNEDADDELVTFADVLAGNDRRWFITITAYADYAVGTFWDLLFTTPAYTPIDYVLNPYGVTAPDADRPWFQGQATVDQNPPIGGDAGTTWSYQARLTCTTKPERLVEATVR